MFAIADKIGVGVYTPAEAAFYARVSTRVMSRWVFGDKQGKPVIKRQLNDPSEKVVTFLDFIQTLAVREVRNRHGLSLQKIREGVEEAQTHYGIEYPLAREHTIYLFSDQRGEGHGNILIRRPEDDQLVQATGRHKGNLMMRHVVEMFLADLRFDPKTGYACEYTPIAEGDVRIALNPHHRFGEPVVYPGGYTADTLWHATNTEGGIREAADAFGVSFNEIMIANKYFDSLFPDRAA